MSCPAYSGRVSFWPMKILVGVCGSIAAYRSPDFVKDLVARGHEVKIVCTESAKKFVSTWVLETVSGSKVLSNDPFGDDHLGTDHISMARWADRIVLYGATAHILSQLAQGQGNDFLLLQILASKNAIIVAPAMNPSMWAHPGVVANAETLQKRGVQFVGPIMGTVTCGETGLGHLADHDEIINICEGRHPVVTDCFLSGKNILISAGSMQSPVDPARRIQNRSSGLMGLELARAARRLGAQVTIIGGQIREDLLKSFSSFRVFRFNQPDTYYKLLWEHFPKCDVFISAAAVLDFEVVYQTKKYSRTELKSGELRLPIRAVPDFVEKLNEIKNKNQMIVGFAAESGTDREVISRAQKKLELKKCDSILVNPIRETSGPETAENQMWLLKPKFEPIPLGWGRKSDLAYLALLEIFGRGVGPEPKLRLLNPWRHAQPAQS